MCSARRDQPVLQPRGHVPLSVNLWQSCHILALLFISFSVFLFLFYQIIGVVRLFWTPFFIHFLHMSQPSQPLLLHKLFRSLYTDHFTNLLIVCFIFQRFPTYHSQHSHFCFSTSFHLPLSKLSLRDHKSKQFSHSFCIRRLLPSRICFVHIYNSKSFKIFSMPM